MPIVRLCMTALVLLAAMPLLARAAPPEPASPLLSVHGTVAHYTLTARGSVDGLVLDDGTQIRLPQRSTDLAFAVRPGDSVTAQGRRPTEAPLFDAVEVKNDSSGVVVLKRVARGKQVVADARVEGRIRFPLFDRKGAVTGAVLEDGTIVRLAKATAELDVPDLTAGREVAVEGPVRVTAMGRVVEIRKLD